MVEVPKEVKSWKEGREVGDEGVSFDFDRKRQSSFSDFIAK